jgi:hypothetical protein
LAFWPSPATVEPSLSSAQQTFRQANGLEHPVQQTADFLGFSWRPNGPLPNMLFKGTPTRCAVCLPLTPALGLIRDKLWKQNKRKRKQMQRTKSLTSAEDNRKAVKLSFSKLASIALIAITSSMQYGCTTQAWYEGVKMNAQNSCANQPPAAYQDCRSRINNQQYDQYEKERAAAKSQ